MWSRADLTALGAALLAGLAASGAAGAPFDPGIAQQRAVGTPPGWAPMARLDASRTGRARSALPGAPHVLWRARVQGGTDRRVAIDERGAIVVASTVAELVQLSPTGHVEWSVRVGPGTPLAGPVITSDGTRVVIESGPSAVGVRPDGTLRYRRALDVASDRPAPEPLALDDGSVVVALGRDVLRLEPDGSVQARVALDETTSALVSRGSAVLVVGERGSVREWKAGLDAARLGSFAGRVAGAVLVNRRSLAAVVDERRLVDLDLATGTRHNRLDGVPGLMGPPALAATGALFVSTTDGVLLGYDRAGHEIARVLLEPGAASGTGVPPASQDVDAPPIIMDAGGRVAFIRPGLDAATVARDGSIHPAPAATCTDPVDLAPAGADRMLVACRSGLLSLVAGSAISGRAR